MKYRERGIPKKVPWEFVNYSFQIEDYFAIMKELNNIRMNPWIDIPSEHVNQLNIDEVFDPLK